MPENFFLWRAIARRKFTVKRTVALLVWASLNAIASYVLAHDFWLEPASFRPTAGSDLPVRIYVGQDFKGDSVIYLPELFERFVYVTPRGEKPVAGVAGDDPVKIPIRDSGMLLLGYRSTLASVEFDTVEEFEGYLVKEGMERILTLRGNMPADKKIREVYSRSAKSLVSVGNLKTKTADKKLGFHIELIAEKNPYSLIPGQTLPVRLLFENKPLAGALVVAFTKDKPLQKLKARTDKDGRVNFTLPHPGVWLLTSVHMIPAKPKLNVDWESFWASLTFELPANPR